MSYLAVNTNPSVLNSGLCRVQQLSGNVSAITKRENKLFMTFCSNMNYVPQGVLTCVNNWQGKG